MPALLVSELDAVALKSQFITIDDLDSMTNWTTAGTVVLDTVNYRMGAAAIKLSGNATAEKPLSGLSLTGTSFDQIRAWLFVANVANLTSVKIRFYDNFGIPNTAEATVLAAALVDGWNRFAVAKSGFTLSSINFNWNQLTKVRLETIQASATPSVTFDVLRMLKATGTLASYTSGKWSEVNGTADIIDNNLVFFDGGYWQLTDLRLKPFDFYRLDKDSTGITVTMADGYVRVAGNGGKLRLLEVINTSFDSKQRLILEQPEYYRNSAIMNSVREAQALPASTLMAGIIDIFRQSYIKLATYMLPNHEVLVDSGDASASDLSLLLRRNRLNVRYVTAHLPMNRDGMKRLVEYFVTSAIVEHTPTTYSFLIKIVSPKGVPANLIDIQNAVERAKPAHLGYSITYTFGNWNDMDASNTPWNTAESYTWDAFEISV